MMKTKRKKENKIWNLNKEDFTNIVLKSSCLSDIMYYLGFNDQSSTNYRRIKERIAEENIPSEHLGNGAFSIRNQRANRKRTLSLKDVLVKNSSYSRCHLKRRLIEEKYLVEICNECGLGTEWQNKKLVLQLDHINGIWNDNRLENLRLLCPNCHTQTETFTRKNNRSTPIANKKIYSSITEIQNISEIENNKIKNKYCYNCGNPISKGTKNGLCAKCYHFSTRKVIRPSKEELEELLEKNSYTNVGRMYGVSDNAVRKWSKYYGLLK